MNFENLINFQGKLREKTVIAHGYVNFEKLRFVCGVDVSYRRKAELLCCCASLFDLKKHEVVMRVFLFSSTRNLMPYVPGFLSFREGDVMVRCVSHLPFKPDVLLVDGNGILHPRRAGLACYVGVKLEIPTVGVAKSLLCGEVRNGYVEVNGEAVGIVMIKNGRKYYVSPGHRIDIEEARRVVELCIDEEDNIIPLKDADEKSRNALRKIAGR